jgi:F0F1-type ATP synthase assembly protein I
MPNDQQSNWGRYLGLGLEMAIGVGLGALVGHWLDNRYGWSGRGTLIGALLGIAAGMYLLVKEALRLNK